MLNVFGAEILSINIQLCTAFSQLDMWDIVRPRVTEALAMAMAERIEERFNVSKKGKEELKGGKRFQWFKGGGEQRGVAIFCDTRRS